jgi:hypothetical protein
VLFANDGIEEIMSLQEEKQIEQFLSLLADKVSVAIQRKSKKY